MIRLAIFGLCALALAACQTEQRQTGSQTPSFSASMARSGAVEERPWRGI